MWKRAGHAATGRLLNLRALTVLNVGLAVLGHPRFQNAPGFGNTGTLAAVLDSQQISKTQHAGRDSGISSSGSGGVAGGL